MSDFNIPQVAIDGVADALHSRTSKNYNIPVIGNKDNIETPQIFEIIPFSEIDSLDARFYAIDGSKNSCAFYNGLSLALYRAGYLCFHHGQQVRCNKLDDPLNLAQIYQPNTILVTKEDDLAQIYDELVNSEPVRSLIDFFGDPLESIFSYGRDLLVTSISKLLDFCQDVIEWACVYDICENQNTKPGDYILRDGTLRSLYIKQPYLVKLGYRLREKGLYIAAITKQSPLKLELSYTYTAVDNYLQSELKKTYSFTNPNPSHQKLCCYFEIRDDVLLQTYGGERGSSQYAKKGITGGRGVGLFFTARLDYVEKLQNYDWLIVDLNILDCIPYLEKKDLTRQKGLIDKVMYELTALTQEHYILGYPYPLVEIHNAVKISADFVDEAIARVKNTLFSRRRMDHTDIENLFTDIHSRF